jgi:hypothetical protein
MEEPSKETLLLHLPEKGQKAEDSSTLLTFLKKPTITMKP